MRKNRINNFQSEPLDDIFINLTPLIDVVFVVLVAFILIAPFFEVEKIDLANSTPSGLTALEEKGKIVIYVRGDDSIWLNNNPVTEQELIAHLSRLKKQNPGLIPQLFQDRKATFGTYQNVRSAAEKAGFESLDVVLKGPQNP